MKTIRYMVGAISFAAIFVLGTERVVAQQSQPTEESKKLPVGSAEERKARMSARANAPAYTKKFDLSGLPHYVPEEKPKGTLRIAGNNYVGDAPLGGWWKEAFEKFQPGIKIEYYLPSAAIAVPRLYFDLADIGINHEPSFYDSLGHLRLKGYEPTGFSVFTGSYNYVGWQNNLVIIVAIVAAREGRYAEAANGLAVARQCPGESEKPGATRDNAGCDEQPEVDAQRTGQDGHYLDGRHMREARCDQHQQYGIPVRRGAQLLEGLKLVVEGKNRLGDLLIGVMAQEIAGDAAQRRSNGGRQRVSVRLGRSCQRHRNEKHVGRNEEDRALDEGDRGEPRLRPGRCRLLQGPIVDPAKQLISPGINQQCFKRPSLGGRTRRMAIGSGVLSDPGVLSDGRSPRVSPRAAALARRGRAPSRLERGSCPIGEVFRFVVKPVRHAPIGF